MSLGRIATYTLLAIAAGAVFLPAVPAQGQWCERMYGYQPRVYGYWPSAYVYPRYGFHHGDIYTTHIGYGEPGFGQRNPGQPNPGQPNSVQPCGVQPEPSCAASPAPSCPANNLQPHPAGVQAADAESIAMPPAAHP